MKKITSLIGAAVLALSMTPASPSAAMPTAAPLVAGASGLSKQSVVEVQYRKSRRHAQPRRGGPRVTYRSGNPYYGGHRGYRKARPGYRRHGAYWFPPAAFAAGAIIGGIIANQPPVRHRSRTNPHIDWCHDRYRSYRASDNSFQPYEGPRRQCRSPYG